MQSSQDEKLRTAFQNLTVFFLIKTPQLEAINHFAAALITK